MKLKHFYPLLSFAVPTVLIAYGIAIPRSCLAGLNVQTVGFGAAILGAGLAYWQGIRLALLEVRQDSLRAGAGRLLGVRRYVPLLIFGAVAAVVGYGFVIPGSCISGINEHSIGFGLTILFAGFVYTQGIQGVVSGEPTQKEAELRGRKAMRVHHFYPLLAFLIPTLMIGYGVVIPRSCIAGINEQTIGFGIALLGACIAYWQGIRLALRRDSGTEGGNNAPS